MTTAKPAMRPARPEFSSGPCAKRPGWKLENLQGALVGRSHRSKPGKARLKAAIDQTREILQKELLRIHAETGKTILFVTHDIEEAIYLGDRVIGMLPHPGRIGIELKINLPRPRDQVATRESPEFLALRRALYDFIHTAERGGAK